MTPNERARGATLLDGGAPLGAALGAIVIAGLIAEFGSWRVSFLVAGVGTMASAACWPGGTSATSRASIRSVNKAEADHIAKAHAVEDAQHPQIGRRKLDAYFRYRSVWCMCLGWMFFNAVFYGLLTWMPSYLSAVHGLDIKTARRLRCSSCFSPVSSASCVGGRIGDPWRARGGQANQVYFSTMFGVAAVFTTVSIFAVAYVSDPIAVVALLLCRRCSSCAGVACTGRSPAFSPRRARSGFLGGCMNLGGNIAGITVPVIVGFIVQATGSYFLALMFFASPAVALLVCSTAIDYSRKLPV